LDHGFADHRVLRDHHLFVRHAQHFLRWLAEYLKRLPEDVSMSNVALKEEHPVIHGGFSNIYLGRYEDSNGIQHDVALKVLKIFENQTEEAQVILYRKFVKEALVWHFLRRKWLSMYRFIFLNYSPELVRR
jgi:hypothetical protein